MSSLKRFCIIGAIITIILGVISHFVYEWSGKNFFVGLFFPVNESTWEHMKLLFFPMLFYALLAGKLVEEEYSCIMNAMFTGILAGLLLIPVLFYTYTGVLGFNADWLNIALYVISVAGAYCRHLFQYRDGGAGHHPSGAYLPGAPVPGNAGQERKR